jgi:hypothetical protein
MSDAMTDAKERPVFVVHLRPEPNIDPIRALRWALKRLLRDYGMRAISIDARIEEDRLDA